VDVAAIVASVVDGDARRDVRSYPNRIFASGHAYALSFTPFSRQYLLEHCLPESEALERVVDTHIYNLRKKLEAAGISGVLVNVRGVGYRFRQP
jgi:hypothetical protein